MCTLNHRLPPHGATHNRLSQAINQSITQSINHQQPTLHPFPISPYSKRGPELCHKPTHIMARCSPLPLVCVAYCVLVVLILWQVDRILAAINKANASSVQPHVSSLSQLIQEQAGVFDANNSVTEATLLPSDKRRPNIVLILWDDAGVSDNGIGAFQAPGRGESVFETPNMNAFADQGMVFTRSYAASSLCAASRASLLWGQSALRHHVR
jgi:hypothetical protein